MQSIRCRCGKIVCQVENMSELPRIEEAPPTALQGPAAVILCRHCKRYVVLRFPTITSIYTASDVAQNRSEPVLATR
jgi:hypothetical protein